MALHRRRLLLKPSKAAVNGQALTHVSRNSLESQIGGEHLEGAFSDPSMDTLLQGFILRAGPPKDIEKGAFRAPKRKSRRGSIAGGDLFEEPSIFEGVSPASETKRDGWLELDPPL